MCNFFVANFDRMCSPISDKGLSVIVVYFCEQMSVSGKVRVARFSTNQTTCRISVSVRSDAHQGGIRLQSKLSSVWGLGGGSFHCEESRRKNIVCDCKEQNGFSEAIQSGCDINEKDVWKELV